MWIVWVVLALIIFVFIVSFVLMNVVAHPKIIIPEECYEIEIQKGKLDRQKWEHDYNREDFEIDSPYGYKLASTLIPAKKEISFDDGKNRVVILVHGFTFNKYGSVKYIDIFYNLGFNVILYDHRNHGHSGKAPTSMGYFEARDLKAVYDYAFSRFGKDSIVGSHGESMGAATSMLHAALDNRVAFVVEDCGFAELIPQLAFSMKTVYHVPVFPFLPNADYLSKKFIGVAFHDVSPVKEIVKCENIPMLFIHGEADTLVPTKSVYRLYDAKPGVKFIKTFPDCNHAECFWKNQNEYFLTVKDFMQKIKVV